MFWELFIKISESEDELLFLMSLIYAMHCYSYLVYFLLHYIYDNATCVNIKKLEVQRG